MGVLALVGRGARELIEQVAVGAMHLDPIETRRLAFLQPGDRPRRRFRQFGDLQGVA